MFSEDLKGENNPKVQYNNKIINLKSTHFHVQFTLKFAFLIKIKSTLQTDNINLKLFQLNVYHFVLLFKGLC